MPPPRPTARCCRAVKQHIRAPSDSIWITDCVLASAFDRYCHVSRLARRASSSVPGPLENRRRMSKRKMTGGLYMDHQSTSPPWAIDFPVDFTRWKWQPPTVRSSREKDLQSRNDQSALLWILKWISKWKWKWKVEETRRPNEVDVERTKDEEGSTSATALLERLSQARLAVAASDPDVIGSAFYNFVGGLEQDLQLGVLDPGAVEMAVSTFPQSLIDANADCEVVNTAIEMFLSAVVNGIASSKILGPKEFDGSFWNQLLKRISQLQINDATALLFQTTLDAVPHIDDVHDGIVAAVQALAVSRSTGRRRAADIGFALRELSPLLHDTLLLKIEAAIYKGSAVFGGIGRPKRRLLWLQILAHMPQVNEDYFVDACVRSACFDHELLGRDLSQLLIQQWTSRGYLQHHKNGEACWNRDSSAREELCLATLIVNICKFDIPGHSAPKMYTIWKLLRRLGHQEELFTSIQHFCEASERVQIVPFKRLAVASGDHNAALRVLWLLDTHSSKLDGTIGQLWDWIAWRKYVGDMIKDESVPIRTIWRVVEFGQWKRTENTAKGYWLMQRRRRLNENMIIWFSQAEHLTDRMALHQINRCIAWLQRHNAKLPNEVMMAILSVATRDMKKGEPGRTERIGWVLNIVEQNLGPEERRKAVRVLRRWREANIELEAKRRRAGGLALD